MDDHIKCHAKYDKTDNATAKRKHKMAKSRPPSVPNSKVINVLFFIIINLPFRISTIFVWDYTVV